MRAGVSPLWIIALVAVASGASVVGASVSAANAPTPPPRAARAVPVDPVAAAQHQPVQREQNPTTLQKKCEKADLQACLQAGAYFAQGRTAKPDIVKARTYYAKACDGRLVQACVALGLSYSQFGVPGRSLGKARQAFDMACTGGAGQGCSLLGMMRKSAHGGPLDLPGARQAFKLACGFKIAAGCFEQAMLLLDERGVPVVTGQKEYRALLVEACDTGHPPACGWLGAAEIAGFGGKKDAKAGRKRAAEACEQRVATGCLAAGNAAVAAIGGPRDLDQGLEWLRAACDTGMGRACYNGAEVMGRFKMQGRDRVQWYADGCARGHAASCFGAAATPDTFVPSCRKFAIRGALLMIGLELERELNGPAADL